MSASAAEDGLPGRAETLFRHRCGETAALLRRRALGTACAAPLVLVALVGVLAHPGSTYPRLVAVAAIVSLAAGLASLALSALLRFDAALFNWMGAFADEMTACNAVDEFLAKAKLKPMPSNTRLLADRIEGAHRILKLQRLMIAVLAAASLLAITLGLA